MAAVGVSRSIQLNLGSDLERSVHSFRHSSPHSKAGQLTGKRPVASQTAAHHHPSMPTTEQFPEGERPSSMSMSMSTQHNPDEGALGLSRSLAHSHNPKQEEGATEENGAANGAGDDDDDSSDVGSGSDDGPLPEMQCSLSLSSSAAAMQLRQAQLSQRFIQLRRQPSCAFVRLVPWT